MIATDDLKGEGIVNIAHERCIHRQVMKRAKKHRKRHLLPGPAGLRQQQRQQKQNDSEHEDATSLSQENYFNDRAKKQKLQADASNLHQLHEHTQIWDAMCVALGRILPSSASIVNSNKNNNHNAIKLLRRMLDPSYTLLSDIANISSLKIPKIVVQISNIHAHGHCDYTVELLDESSYVHLQYNMKTASKKSTLIHTEIGWLSQSLIKNHPEWFVQGTVLFCQNVSIAVFHSQRRNRNSTSVRNQQQDFDRMLVLSEENVVYAWTKDQVDSISHEQYLDLLERRSDVENRWMIDLDIEEDEDEECDADEIEEIDADTNFQMRRAISLDDCPDTTENSQRGASTSNVINPYQRLRSQETNTEVEEEKDEWSNVPTSSVGNVVQSQGTVVINEGRLERTEQRRSSDRPPMLNNNTTNIQNDGRGTTRQVETNTTSRPTSYKSSGDSGGRQTTIVSNGGRLVFASASTQNAATSNNDTRIQTNQSSTGISRGGQLHKNAPNTTNMATNPYLRQIATTNHDQNDPTSITRSQVNTTLQNNPYSTQSRSSQSQTISNSVRNPHFRHNSTNMSKSNPSNQNQNNSGRVASITPNEVVRREDSSGQNQNLNNPYGNRRMTPTSITTTTTTVNNPYQNKASTPQQVLQVPQMKKQSNPYNTVTPHQSLPSDRLVKATPATLASQLVSISVEVNTPHQIQRGITEHTPNTDSAVHRRKSPNPNDQIWMSAAMDSDMNAFEDDDPNQYQKEDNIAIVNRDVNLSKSDNNLENKAASNTGNSLFSNISNWDGFDAFDEDD